MHGKSLSEIAEMVHDLAKEKGWHDSSETEDQFVERTTNNFHDEVSELHEAWRNNRLHAPCDKAATMEALGIRPLTCLEEEMADIIIRVLDSCVRLGVDIEHAVISKHEFNKSRSYRHGGKRS